MQVAPKMPSNTNTQNATNSQRNRVNSQTSAFRSRMIRNLSSGQHASAKEKQIEENKHEDSK